MIHFSKNLVLVLLMGGSLGLVGCGNGKVKVTGVDVEVSDVEGDAFAAVDIDIENEGNFRLPAFDLPIIDPKNPGEIYGTLSSKVLAGNAGNQVGVSVNLTKALRVPLGDPSLPNGADLPIAGLEDAALIRLPVAMSRSEVYIAIGNGVAVVGATLSIKEFDRLSQYTPGLNIFPYFCFDFNVCASAGVYLGEEEGKSGIGLFVDASQVVYNEALALGDDELISVMSVADESLVGASLSFEEGDGSNKEKKVFSKKYKQLEKEHESGVLTLN